MRLLRPVLVALALAAPLAAPAAARAEATEADPFRARLTQNIPIATKARTILDAQARRKPPKSLTPEQRRAYDDQTKWLAETAARFGVLEARMKAAAAKPRASASEIAQINAEFGAARDTATNESQRFEPLAPACKERHAATVAALRG